MADFNSIWSPAKVFSPTTAKQTSLQQKDWTYVDQFLSSRFAPNPVPKFERNPDTLRVLLALTAANEAADEEKFLELRVKEKTLAELRKRDTEWEESRMGKRKSLLSAVEENLTPEGTRCLNSVALLSVALASNSTEPEKLASHFVRLSVQEAAVAQQTLCMDGLHSRLKADLMNLNSALRELEADDNLTIPCDMATKVNEWIRTSRHLKNKTEDYKERLETMEKNPSARGLTIPALAQTEKEILSLKERVLDLEAQTRGFQGLPPEKDLARLEVERVQGELEGLQAKLEKLYDGMISGSR